MECLAHAKLNLALNIAGTRSDGYHEVDTIMQEITLADRLIIHPADTIRVDCPGVQEEDNTVFQAAQIFFEAADIQGGASIRIEKHIPMGSGLGGGSSDATAALRALNELHGNPLSQAQLHEAAARIGADAPFFLYGGTQRACGIGEKLTQIADESDFLYLLVKPEQSVSTGRAYALYDALPKEHTNMEAATSALSPLRADLFFTNARNSLRAAARELVPEIDAVAARCKELGAVYSGLTGSGSCVFSVFETTLQRQYAKTALKDDYPFVASVERFS